MIEDIDEYVTKYEDENDLLMVDNWYDFAYEEIETVLKRLTDEDWIKLINIVLTKSDNWKKRIAYCYVEDNSNYVQLLLSMINTNDIKLFEIIIYNLTKCDYNYIDSYNMEVVLSKIHTFLPHADYIASKVFMNFVKKASNKNNVK